MFSWQDIIIPTFSSEIYELILAKGNSTFRWSEINPTIFGSVFESTLNAEVRKKGGMHYTSVENIHKVIDALFLKDLKAEFQAIRQLKPSLNRLKNGKEDDRTRKLRAFQDKLAHLTFLDPACGSGNFLTETYLSLRRLENEVIRELTLQQSFLSIEELNPIKVSIQQFFGIEINDFAVSVARTALWIAESQMVSETSNIINRQIEFFPLQSYSNILEADALTTPWSQVLDYSRLSYIIGNPPFIGCKKMSPLQRQSLRSVFDASWDCVGEMDFVCGWFKKAADIIEANPHVRAAFVATSSICQGTSVANLWQRLLSKVSICFAYTPFEWDNEATDKAAVQCVIIGLEKAEKSKASADSKAQKTDKYIYSENAVKKVHHINAFLTPYPDFFLSKRSKPLFNAPVSLSGNKPIDGGNYLFEAQEKEEFLKVEPQAAPYFKPWYGSKEITSGQPRYCLYLADCTINELAKLPMSCKRIENVRQMRLQKQAAQKYTDDFVNNPTCFHVTLRPKGDSIAIPQTFTDGFTYIPATMIGPEALISNLAVIIPEASWFHFGVICSHLHYIWLQKVCCMLGSAYRYTINPVYNNFPWPEEITPKLSTDIANTAKEIMQVRAASRLSLTNLYNTKNMLPQLRAVHQKNDRLVLQAYGIAHNASDEDIMLVLINLYNKRVQQLSKSKGSVGNKETKRKSRASAKAEATETKRKRRAPAK